ncbi:hypothetical protein CDAR_387901 [Caerostris darwini]|uniref:Uncharacterized protein n=1 Tax=Caerostris darwini TaxID=1538125 RepID=A0AAV4SZN8_9ARAC|nr:hypothetical protein CDAR_387901 [Caerostris darwini]
MKTSLNPSTTPTVTNLDPSTESSRHETVSTDKKRGGEGVNASNSTILDAASHVIKSSNWLDSSSSLQISLTLLSRNSSLFETGIVSVNGI